MMQQKREKRPVSGWLVLNKPVGISSTGAVGKCRWLLKAKKAGHAGTLDPLASGILPIAFGEATKTVPQVQNGTKVYRFALKWGVATSTDDAEGAVIATSDFYPSEAAVRAKLPEFSGTITQIPPAFSAVKIDGERAYDLARAGAKPDMPARDVRIDSFDLVSHGADVSAFEVICAKGTYVRALARDLAEALGSKGHVCRLHRAAVGAFNENDAVGFAEFEAARDEERLKFLKPVAAGLIGVTEIRLDARQAATVRFGNPVLLTGQGAPIAVEEAWASLMGAAVAIGCVEQGQFKPKRVILGG